MADGQNIYTLSYYLSQIHNTKFQLFDPFQYLIFLLLLLDNSNRYFSVFQALEIFTRGAINTINGKGQSGKVAITDWTWWLYQLATTEHACMT